LLHQLIYVSKMTTPMPDEDIKSIVESGKYNNHKGYLTGCLIYSNECFMEYIEGDIFKLNHLFSKISGDHRHKEILLLGLKEISHRLYNNYTLKKYSDHFNDFPQSVLDEMKPSEYDPFPMSMELAME